MPLSLDHKRPNPDKNPRDHELLLVFSGATDGSDQNAISKVIDLTLKGARLNLQSIPNYPQIEPGSELYELLQACRLAGYNGKVDVRHEYKPDYQLMVTFQIAKSLSEKFLLAKKAGDDISADENVKAKAKAIECDVFRTIAKLKFFMELGGRLDLASYIKCPNLPYVSPFFGLLGDCKLVAYSSAKKTESVLTQIIARAKGVVDFANLRLHDYRIFRCIPAKELGKAVQSCLANLAAQDDELSVTNFPVFLGLLQQKKVLFLPEVAGHVCKAIIKIVDQFKKSKKINEINNILQSLADKGILSILVDRKIDNLSLGARLAKLQVQVDVFVVRAGNNKLKSLEKFRAKGKSSQIPPQQTAEQIKYLLKLNEEILLHFGIDTKKPIVPNAAASQANGNAVDVKATAAAAILPPAQPVSESSAAIHKRLSVSDMPKAKPSVRRSSIVAGGKVLVMKTDSEARAVNGAAANPIKPRRHQRNVTSSGPLGHMSLAAWEEFTPKPIPKLTDKTHPLAAAKKPPVLPVYSNRPATPANAPTHGRRCTMG